MDCAIWLNRRKIFSADEISENFDIAAIRGYFLGGSLIKWLVSHGGSDLARHVEKLSPTDPALNDRLTEIFTNKKCNVPVHKADENLIRTIELLKGGIPVTGSAQAVCDSGSYTAESYSGSFAGGLYAAGSFAYGSFGSYRHKWEWEWGFGSFRTSSFGYSLGGSFAYDLGSYRYSFGSYRVSLGSFAFGSFAGGSFRDRFTLGSFRFDTGYGMGSYRGFPVGGSFRSVTSDEYDEIMYRCLNICPLNRFGYGIHLI